MDRYGTECLGWSLQTWLDEIRDDCGVDLHPRNVDKLGAALVRLIRPDEFYRSVPGFLDLVEGMAAEWFNPNTAHPPTTLEIAVTLAESYLLDPPDPKDPDTFDPQIVRLVNMVARSEGFRRLPGIIRAFGIDEDKGLDWGADLSGDPDLSELNDSFNSDRENDLEDDVRDHLAELADRYAKLPLNRHDPKPVAAGILKQLDGLGE